jgi:hypothetical protein
MAFLLALALAAAHAPVDRSIDTPGCQGEACWTTGVWFVKAPLPLYATVPGKPIAILRKGTRLEAYAGIVRTTRVGQAVLIKDVANYLDGKVDVSAPKGTHVRIIYDAGEGYYAALMPDDTKLIVAADDIDRKPIFKAEDWIRVQLPSGRLGFIRHDYYRLDCSSYYDDVKHCRALGADNWSQR